MRCRKAGTLALAALTGAAVSSTLVWAQSDAGLPAPATVIGDIPDIDPSTFNEATTDGAVDGAIPLFLMVIINGRETGLIAEFELSEDGRLSSTSSELEEVGIRAPGLGNRRVYLDALNEVSYYYDEVQQLVEIKAPPDALLPREIAGRQTSEFIEPQPGYGAVLNYHITGSFGDNLLEDGFRLQSLFAPLEARLYAPIGVLTTTGHVSATEFDLDNIQLRRHDTHFVYSNPRRLLSFTVGDTVSSSLPWTRPIRIGGVQLRRDFSLRSDVVTSPLLSYSGVAAVPSAIDLYIDNVRTWSGATEAGPFVVTDLPLVNSRGEAIFVLRDEAGNETVTTVPFFATRDLLKKGQLDFSLEAGRAREDFGISNFAYGDGTLTLATVRYGATDRLTLQGHLEHASDLLSGNMGIATVLFNQAEISIAAGASRHGDATGQIGHLNLRTEVGGADINLSSTRTFGEYRDLAYTTGLDYLGPDASEVDIQRLRPPRAQDALSVSFPFEDAQLSVSFIHSERADFTTSVASVSYSQQFDWRDSTLRLNAFHDISSSGTGLVAAFSIPLGKRTTANAGLSRGLMGDLRATAAVARQLDQETGGYGYLGEVSATEDGSLSGRGSASYRSPYGVAEAGLRYEDSTGRAATSASFEGALVAAGGGVFAGNRIADAFAVVDVGVPDVPIELHNRPVARSGASGRALIPNLQSYRNNRISIDPNDLPLDAAVDATAMNVVPARRSGVSVTFGGDAGSSALVVLRTDTGEFVEAGSRAVLNAEGEAIPVGYDGEIWMEDLRSQNRLVVETGRGTCTATFTFEPAPGEIVVIDPVECS